MTHEKNITISTAFKNFESTDALRLAVEEKISTCLKKFVHHDTEVHVVLKVEKTRQIIEATFHVDGAHFQAKEESADMYASLDLLVNNISRQVSKHKDKITAHHQGK